MKPNLEHNNLISKIFALTGRKAAKGRKNAGSGVEMVLSVVLQLILGKKTS